ncbi:MAG TPA: hypothetical protein VHT68_19450 [Pseudolabrys sp.]|nr:hypothetical protein [Pseudolabrys sp.]
MAQVARDYDLTASSVHRHRVNCLKLGSSNEIKKEAARGTAAVALLPSKEDLNSVHLGIIARIDEVIAEAKRNGSLQIVLNGLNSIRHTVNDLARLAGHLQPASAQVNVPVQNINVTVVARQVAERLIQEYDHEPEHKARIARVLKEDSHDTAT